MRDEIYAMAKRELLRQSYAYDLRFGKFINDEERLRRWLEFMKRGDAPDGIKYCTFRYEDRPDTGFFKRTGFVQIDLQGEVEALLAAELKEGAETRSNAMRDYIAQQGLQEHTEEIIAGMKKTEIRVMAQDRTAEVDIFMHREIAHHDALSLLRFGLDYIDRWKTYNELFET